MEGSQAALYCRLEAKEKAPAVAPAAAAEGRFASSVVELR